MIIPPRLEESLRKDNRLHAAVLLSYADFKPWLDASGTPFFPEYTDHSERHILQVLLTASSLIRDEAWQVLTPADAALLCLATLLHDSAMHLTEDGFLSLIQRGSRIAILAGEPLWPDLWTDFLSEASRFDGRKLKELFGDTEPIQRPSEDPMKWSLRDRLLMGEFVRRHHARLAHEIAIIGVPGPPSVSDRLSLRNIELDLAELTGLIARSHGIPLRDCLNHLVSTDIREYKGVHAVFLMALLRIGDYLQMQEERAPLQVLRVKTLRSPLSQREWKVHHAVKDIRTTHSDPEAVFVQVAPTDVGTYLKLKRRLEGLQAELDSSWAVMGEVYGRFGALSNLGLLIRRVRSNLDDQQAFAKSVDYIPCEAKFDAAGVDLLKLLIHPLYGDKPEIGIREMMQNAIDACIELKDFLKRFPAYEREELPDQDGDVVITLEELVNGERHLTVSDRGIGMTPVVVLDYFLKAGASFRRSDAWRQQYESDSGESRILRSGRFGVGALAAFLLGDELEISTRHITAGEGGGICFTATLDSEEIQLNKCLRSVGTTIRVRISRKHVWDSLTQWYFEERNEKSNPLRQWDFYCGSDPKVQRVLIQKTERTVLPQRRHFPKAGTDASPPWHRISVPEYADVYWRNQRNSRLVCNNILVSERSRAYEERDWVEQGFFLRRPTVSVFDPDGRLPLNLQRTGLVAGELPFQDLLRQSQCEDFIAWVMANAPTSALLGQDDSHPDYPGIECLAPRLLFALTSEGSILIEPWTFARISPSRVVFFPSRAGIEFSPRPGELIVPLEIERAGIDARRAWLRTAFGWNLREAFSAVDMLSPKGRRTIVSTSFFNDARKPGVTARSFWVGISVGPSNTRWTVLSSGVCEGGRVDFNALLNSEASTKIEGLTEYFDVSGPLVSRGWVRRGHRWPVAEVWARFSEHVVIPYDLTRRRELYRKAYEAMRPTIEYYQRADKKERVRDQSGVGEHEAG